MTKTTLLALITKLTTSLKGIFPLKTQVATDISTAKTQAVSDAKTYTDNAVATATDGSANTTYVDNKIAELNTAISAYQATIDGKIDTRVSALGTFIGTADTYAGLPTTDQLGKAVTAGDFVHLTKKDGSNKKGLYRYDGTQYVFVSADPAIVDILNSLKYTTIDDTNDDKFVTGKYIKDREDANALTQDEVDQAVADA
jgi:hypothetical protein